MTPKEKAKELFELFYAEQTNIEYSKSDEIDAYVIDFYEKYEEETNIYWNKLAKQSALICVDDKINMLKQMHEEFNKDLSGVQTSIFLKEINSQQNIKNEIAKL